MMQKADFFKSRIENTCFVLRLYEMYAKRMPQDKGITEMCACYRERYNRLLEENSDACIDEKCSSFTEEENYDGIQNQTFRQRQ